MTDEHLTPSSATTEPEPLSPSDADPAAYLDAAASRAPIHRRDRVPGWLLRAQAWVAGLLSSRTRTAMSIVVILLVLVIVLRLSGLRLLGYALGIIDPFVLLFGVFLVNWLGNGGVLVPIPGARFVGLLLVFQHAVMLPALEVWLVSGTAMALGLLSYYLAGARTAQSYAAGDAEEAEKLAVDSGMLGEETEEFAPGAEMDARAALALAGTADPSATPEPEVPAVAETRARRLRRRFTSSLQRTQERAQPVIEQRGTSGMLLLCFAPTPMGTAAAYLGGLMRFGFARYLVASFAAKFLLAGIIVVLALVFSDAAHAVDIPEIELPIIDITLFEDGLPELPAPAASRSPEVVAD